MDAELLVSRVLDDEGIPGDLDEKEASQLVNWTVSKAETIAKQTGKDETKAEDEVAALCRFARKVSQIVSSARDGEEEKAKALAQQLQLSWPKVSTPGELLTALLAHSK
jgi:hypothetical protein